MVSTENLGNNNPRALALFLIVSLALHLLFFAWIKVMPSLLVSDRRPARPERPIYVDVVQLPPAPEATPVKPEETSRFAQRSQTVKKESAPERKAALPRAKVEKEPKDMIKTQTRPREEPEMPTIRIPPMAGDAEAPKPVTTTLPDRTDAIAPRAEAPRTKADEAAIAKKTPRPEAKPTDRPSEGAARPLNLLPSKERLEELAKQYEASPPKGEKSKTLALNTTELRFQRYLMMIKERIEFYWEYPLASARNGEQGKLKIDFKIKKDGTVEFIRLMRTSSFPMLDDGAVTAIRLASPFNPFPEEMQEVEDIEIHASFEYELIRRR